MSSAPHRPSPDPLTLGALALAVVAVSSSAPLVAYATASALAIAFWRNLLSTAVLGPVALVRRRAEFRALVAPAGRRDAWYCVLSGVALAAHFATWMPSAKLTTVAAATALVATQPVWQGLIARVQGRRLSWGVWVGIGVAVAGAGLATGADVTVSGRAFLGDLLAIVGGMFAAVYTALGERARRTLSTTTYTTVCYGVCALLLLVVCLVGQVRLTGFDTRTWLVVLALVAGAQLLGHSMFNFALRRVSATTVSVLILLEAPGAALIGWVWLDQLPRPLALCGLALLLTGVAVVILASARTRRTGPTPPVPPTVPADATPLREQRTPPR
ncbi:DMT family transporter [Micromonospora sp. NPDC126480]|uniref:DMT family transporter n=1 Tax=Micromonospora sp. NPDC126480 TaxID=3155312 RepID=UPI00331B9E97